jgi:hypothetical protein
MQYALGADNGIAAVADCAMHCCTAQTAGGGVYRRNYLLR